MENRLLKISFVKVLSDAILIKDKNDFDHVQNLKAVLDILYENGLRLKRKKCFFMQPEIIYLEFRINKEWIFLLPEKIYSIKNAKFSTNTSELK